MRISFGSVTITLADVTLTDGSVRLDAGTSETVAGVEFALLAGTVVLVMVVELLNTGIETAIDRIGPDWHDLSKRAKDMGSAAVLLSLLVCGGTWAAALWARFA